MSSAIITKEIMNTTIVYRDMIAANPRTCVDELDHVYPTMRCSIRASIADGARKGVTAQMTRWQVLEAGDLVAVKIWPMFHAHDEEQFSATLIMPWEHVDQSHDESWRIDSDNDELVYAEIFAAMSAGRDHGYILTNDDQRVVAWSVQS